MIRSYTQICITCFYRTDVYFINKNKSKDEHQLYMSSETPTVDSTSVYGIHFRWTNFSHLYIIRRTILLPLYCFEWIARNEYRGRNAAAIDPIAIVLHYYYHHQLLTSCVIKTPRSVVWSMSMTPLPKTRRLRRIRQMLTTLICCSGVLYYIIYYVRIMCKNVPQRRVRVSPVHDGMIMTLLSSVCVCVCVTTVTTSYIRLVIILYTIRFMCNVCVHKKSHDRLSAHVQRLIFKFRFRHNETNN